MAEYKKKSNIVDMTQGRPVKLLLAFMVPMLIGNLFQQLYNMVDSMIVGKFVGAEALAAVGATGSLNFLFFSICAGLSSGIGIIVSQRFGAGEEDEVKKTIANAIYIMVVAAIMMGGLGVILSRSILSFLKTPDNILDNATLYMQISCAGVIAISIFNCVSSILRGVGDSKTPLYFLIVASMINIVLDLIFVRTLNWGVAGVAIATIIAQLISGLGCLIYAIKCNPFFIINKDQMKMDYGIIHNCVRIGIPLAFQTSLIAISCVALQSVVNTFGSVVVAAFTATSRIEQLVQQPYNSLGMAMSTYAGQNIGAGRKDRVKQGYFKGMLIMIIFSLIMMPVMRFGGESIMKMFVDDPEVIALGARGLTITSLYYALLGTIYVTRGLLNGVGDAAFALINGITEVIGRIGFPKPVTMIPSIGVFGIWHATGLTWAITGIVSMIRYFSGTWDREVKHHNI